MNEDLIISKTRDYVKETLQGEGSGHDWFHTERVWKLACKIASLEVGRDLFVIQ